MTSPALHPDAVATKFATLKHWRDTFSSRPESLGNWQITRGPDGRLHVSAQLRGPDPAGALRVFVKRQGLFLSERMGPSSDDAMPQMDVSEPGRTAAFWRLSGVWVEVWHYDADSCAPVRRVQGLPVATVAPVRRGLGGRLPFTRNRNRRLKEASTA